MSNAIYLTEEYGVLYFSLMWLWAENMFSPRVTLYNDDYGVAVLDFLVNKTRTRKEKIMKIGIVGAMAQEVEILSQLMIDKRETKSGKCGHF